MMTNFLARISAVLLATFMFAGQSVAGSKPHLSQSRAIEGTWTVQVTQVDCESGNPLGASFLSLLTFSRGGTLTETTANPMFYPAERGPGHGIWGYSHHAFRASSIAFITNNGALAKTQTITQQIQMQNPDQFSSTATVQFFDPSGNLLGSGCATAVATRYK